MNPNFKTYRLVIFILGILAALFLTVYQDSTNIMYPGGAKSFSNMFYGAVLVSFVIGALLPLQSLRGTLSTIGISLLLLMSIATIFVGLSYAYNTKSEEFPIYFLLNALTTLVYVLGAVLIAKFILMRSGLTKKEVFNLILSGVVGVLIGFSVNLFKTSIESIHIWYGISILLIFTFLLTRGERNLNQSMG